MKHTAKKLIALLAALSLLAGCGAAGTGPAEELPPVDLGLSGATEVKDRPAADQVFSVNYDPEGNMNPVRADNPTNMQFWSLMYDSVFIVDESFEVYSEVVTSYNTEDYLWWVFQVDTSIPFTDGSTMTAGDVVYSILRAQQSEYYKERLSNIYGISSLDDGSFAISTKEANAQLPLMLNIPIIKKGDYFEDFPAGSGPYRLSEEGDRLVLFEENRHAKEMPLDTIYLIDCMDTNTRIRSYEDASLDIVTNDPTGMYNLGYASSNDTRYLDTTNMQFIGFNMNSMYFSGYPARRAVGYLLDRDAVVTELMNGCAIPASLPLHPKSNLYDKSYADTFTYDPGNAAILFENAGVDDYDHDGELEMMVTGIVVELKIRMIVNNDSTAKVMAARRLCEELNALGMTTTLWELSFNDYIEALENGEYDLYYGEIRLTPDWNLSRLFLPREPRKSMDDPFVGINYADVRDPRFTELYAAYLEQPEGAGRAAAMQAVCKYIGDTAVILPICFERREVLTHRGVVTGISATQYDLYHRFYNWNINLNKS